MTQTDRTRMAQMLRELHEEVDDLSVEEADALVKIRLKSSDSASGDPQMFWPL